jgi:ech hydrogenase subunit A
MDGLFGKMPRLAGFMIVGIAGMFLAPFGMLVSKWAVMRAFADAGHIMLIVIIAFGSAVTLFYWAKWLGKMVAIVANRENIQDAVHTEEWGVLGTLTTLVIAVCLMFPIISSSTIIPFLQANYKDVSYQALGSGNMYIMVGMLVLIVALPVFFYGKTNKKIVPIYLSGVNEGDNLNYLGSMDKDVAFTLRNWYMEDYFGEKKMSRIGNIATITVIIGAFALLLQSLVAMLGGGN